MVRQDIIAPVMTPTPWVSSLVVFPKKDGKIRLWLDNKDLDQAIQGEHYPLPTVEDVATRLHGARDFSKLDVKNGYWHVKIDDSLSYLVLSASPI